MITRDEKNQERLKALEVLRKAKEKAKTSKGRWIRLDDKTIVKVKTRLTDAAYRSRYHAKRGK